MLIRILIADDHIMLRQGLTLCLALDPDLQVVGEAGNGVAAVRMTVELEPDVVLMDLLMPIMDGIVATAAIREQIPDSKVVVLTSVLDDKKVITAIRAGAIGYILKNADAAELVTAIKAAAAGQSYLSRDAATRLTIDTRDTEKPDALTEREVEILRLVAVGRANKEIGNTLHITEQTVKVHVSNILSKLGVQSRTQAALHAVRAGLIPSDTPAHITV